MAPPRGDEEFAAFLAGNIERWRQVAREAGTGVEWLALRIVGQASSRLAHAGRLKEKGSAGLLLAPTEA